MEVGLIPYSPCCSVPIPRARKLQNSFKKSEFGVRETEYLLKVSEISRGRNKPRYKAGNIPTYSVGTHDIREVHEEKSERS